MATTKRVNLELCNNEKHCRVEIERLQKSLVPYMEQIQQVIDGNSFLNLCVNNDVFLQVEGNTLDYIVAVGPKSSTHKTMRLQPLSDLANLDCIGNIVTTLFIEGAVKITSNMPYGRELLALEQAGFKEVGVLSHELLTDGSTGNIVILEMLHPRLIEATKPIQDEPQDEVISPTTDAEPVVEPSLKVIRIGERNGEEKRQEERLLSKPLESQSTAPFEQIQGRRALPGGLGYDEITFERR